MTNLPDHAPAHFANTLSGMALAAEVIHLPTPSEPWATLPSVRLDRLVEACDLRLAEALASDGDALPRFDQFMQHIQLLIDWYIDDNPVAVIQAVRQLACVDVPPGDCLVTAKLEVFRDRRDEWVEILRAHLGVEPAPRHHPDIHVRLVRLPRPPVA